MKIIFRKFLLSSLFILPLVSCAKSEPTRSCAIVKSETALAQIELDKAKKLKAQTCKERQRELGGDCEALESFTNALLEVNEQKTLKLIKEQVSSCLQ